MPIVTTVLGKGYDVLLCTEDIDEFCMMSLGEYAKQDGDEDVTYAVKNVSSEDLGLTSDEEKRQAEEATQENQGLFEAMADALGGRVQKVVVSTRLTDAPAVLTTEGPLSLQMEATLRHMPGAETDDGLPASTVVLEMNDKHPVFETLKAAHAAGDGDKVRRYASLLFDQALLVEGLPVPDPIAFAQAVTELMK